MTRQDIKDMLIGQRAHINDIETFTDSVAIDTRQGSIPDSDTVYCRQTAAAHTPDHHILPWEPPPPFESCCSDALCEVGRLVVPAFFWGAANTSLLPTFFIKLCDREPTEPDLFPALSLVDAHQLVLVSPAVAV